ncbi:hypothetical protein ACTMU2_35345 (plasmid) [Cupriavidus basilensis]
MTEGRPRITDVMVAEGSS